MTRRTAALGLVAAAQLRGEQPEGPGDIARLNSFATLYNLYMEQLNHNLIDSKLWARVQRAWNALR